jgi:hypothetical protein
MRVGWVFLFLYIDFFFFFFLVLIKLCSSISLSQSNPWWITECNLRKCRMLFTHFILNRVFDLTRFAVVQ